MRKNLSRYQFTANRRNGHLSTGPKTINGKAVSKMNALKHGLRSAEVVVRGRCIKESPREFRALYQGLRGDRQPVGMMEEMLVEQIATTLWRLQRVLKAESGEIALSVDGGQLRRETSEPYGLAFWVCCATYGGAEAKLKNSSEGNMYLEHALRDLRQSVEKEGAVTEIAFKSLVDSLAGKPNPLTNEFERFRQRQLQNPDNLPPSDLKKQALVYIDRQLESISLRKAECEEREAMEEKSRQAADVLPSAETLEKLLRYEKAIRKELYRAMNYLERLQRRRQGENVPPPQIMEISTGS